MIAIKVGYNSEQRYSISDEEAHKAYYLFLNPEKRGIFKDGLALIGKHIQSIEPDYQGTMGWNHTHQLDDDDWNEIRGRRIDRRLRNVLQKAKQIAYLIPRNPQLLNQDLNEIENQNENRLRG